MAWNGHGYYAIDIPSTRDAHEGHKSFTGELVGASEREVTIAADNGIVAIPYDDISRSNLVEE